MRWLFDPLHRLSKRQQWFIYGMVTAYTARLFLWYLIEDQFGEP